MNEKTIIDEQGFSQTKEWNVSGSGIAINNKNWDAKLSVNGHPTV